ncbi:MAG: hypothetical protein KC912_14050 [Proteobacteria bacterium]|nr:hypothetical protein [Pseudomonadota bacterium]
MRALSLLLLIGCTAGDTDAPDSADDSNSTADSGTETGAPAFELTCEDATSEGWTGTDDLGPTIPLTTTVSDGFDNVEYRWTWTAHPTPYVPGLDVAIAGGWADVPTSGVKQALLAGDYTVQVDARSGTEEATCSATATVARQGLTVELFSATNSTDDFDLHFVAPGGTLGSNDDCHHANCQNSLEWGVLGDEDNPALWAARPVIGVTRWDFDIVRLMDPPFGSFSIYVHDNTSSSETGSTSFTVRIWDGETLLAELDRTVSGEGTDTLVANLEWPTGIVTEPS